MRKFKQLSTEQLAPFVFEPADAPVDWEQLFGNDRPVEIEVGFGKGAFLVAASEHWPQRNFLGVEIERKYFYYVAGRLARRGLRNARACCFDGAALLAGSVADASVDVVHVYFPDPWWKRRHWKRRLFTPEFAATCARIIRPGGRLSLATDVEEYFGVMTETVADLPAFAKMELPEEGPEVTTNFERKALERGGSVWRAVYERR